MSPRVQRGIGKQHNIDDTREDGKKCLSRGTSREGNEFTGTHEGSNCSLVNSIKGGAGRRNESDRIKVNLSHWGTRAGHLEFGEDISQGNWQEDFVGNVGQNE